MKSVGSLVNGLYILESSDCQIRKRLRTSTQEYAVISYYSSVMFKEITPIPESIKRHARVEHPRISNYNRLAKKASLPKLNPDNIKSILLCLKKEIY